MKPEDALVNVDRPSEFIGDRHCQILFEQTLDALVIVNAEGQILQANAAAYDILNIAPDQETKVLEDVLGIQDSLAWLWNSDECVTQRGELFYVDQQGQSQHLFYVATSQFRPGQHLITIRDLVHVSTAIRNKDIKQERSPQFFGTRELDVVQDEISVENPNLGSLTWLKGQPDQIAIEQPPELRCRFLPDGTLTSVNAAYCRYSNKTPEDLIGESLTCLLPESQQSVAHALLARLNQLTSESSQLIQDCPVIYPNDHVGWQEWLITALFDDHNHLLEFQAIGRDISDRKQRLIDIQQSEALYRALFEQASLGITRTTLDGTICQVNPKIVEILGYPADELVGHNFQEFTFPDDLEQNLKEFQDVVSGHRSSFTLEKRYVRKDGSFVWGRITASLLRDEQGEPMSLLGILEDISDRKQAELELQDKEEKYLLATQAGHVGIWAWNLETNEIYLDPILKEMLGYQDCEIGSHIDDWRQYVYAEDLPIVLTAMMAHLDGHTEDYKIEHRMVHKDGSLRWILSRGVALRSPDGHPYRVIGTDTDITQQKYDQHLIKTSQQRFKDLVNAIDGVVWEADAATLQFTFVSQQAEDWFGYSCDQWLSHATFWQDHIHPDDQCTTIKKCIEETHAGRSHDLEYRMVKADGTVVWVRDLINVIVEDGVPTKLCGVMIDITSWKQSEGLLHQYKRIVSQVSDRIALVDRNYRYVISNQAHAAQFGQRPEDVVGQTVAELIGDQFFFAVAKEKIDQSFAGETIQYEKWYDYPDQGSQFLSLTYVPYHEPNGSISGVIASIRNLTDLKRAEMLLLQQAEREVLLANISNHIRRSLDLSIILDTAVTEVRSFLQADRVLIYQIIQSKSGKVRAESVGEPWMSLYGFVIGDPCLQQDSLLTALRQGRIQNLSDIHRANLADCYLDMLNQFQVRANLVIPIVYDDKVWGLLIAQQCSGTRVWNHEEVSLLQQLTGQLAIALQQSELYHHVQKLNTKLEDKVRQRTSELRQALQSESLLRRITDNVRDSLDEFQILETVVRELALGLNLKCCDTGIYNAEQTHSTITHEYLRSLNSAYNKTFSIQDATHPEVYSSLLQGQAVQFSDIIPNPIRVDQSHCTILACPIIDDHGVLGDLWLFKECSEVFNHLEVRLVEQVANQCAIAIRQARLYQATQNQVVELERLNHLKDDFLSTISHELRTPMSSIQMATQILEVQLTDAGFLSPDSDQSISRYFQLLKDECVQEMTLINTLLDLTQVEADTDPLMPIMIQLKPWVMHLVETMMEQVEKQHQHLHINIPEELELCTDLSYLERILIELFNNACKYTPADETISIIAQQRQATVQVMIINSGVMIPETERDRIFEKFYRIPNNDPWRYGGTGLGLALTKRLTERLGATIQVESDNNQVRVILDFPNMFPDTEAGMTAINT